MRKGISHRIQIVYALLLAIVILSTFIVSYMSSSRQLEKEVVHSNLNMLDQVNKRIEGSLSAIDQATIQLLQTKESQFYYNTLRSQEPDYLLRMYDLQELLSSLKSTYPSIESVYMYANRNKMIISDEAYDPLQSSPAAKWIPDYAEDPTYYRWIARPFANEGGLARHTVTLLRHFPVAERPENRIGMIAVNIKEDSLSQMFSDLRFSENGNVFVLDQQGAIISHNDKSKIDTNIAEFKYGSAILSRKDSGWLQDKNSTYSEWVFYSASQYTGWKLVYIVSQAQVSNVLIAIRNILVAVAAVMILLTVTSVVFVNRKWFKPIETFIDKIELLIDKQPQTTRLKGVRTSADLGSLENRIRRMVVSYSDAERQLHESKPALKLQILFDIFTGHRSRYDRAKTYFEPIGISLLPEHYLVMTVELDNRSKQEKITDLNLYLYAICNMAEELMRTNGPSLRGAAVQMNEFQAAILLNFNSADAEHNESAALSFAQSLRDAADKYFKQSISIGIGSHYRRFSDIHVSYRESQQRIHYKLVAGRRSIITRSDAAEDSTGLMQLYDLAEDMLEAIRQANMETVGRILDAMFGLAADNRFTHQGMIQFVMQLVYRAGKASADAMIMEYLQQEHSHIERQLEHSDTIDAMKQLLASIMGSIIDLMLEKRTSRRRTGDIVGDIIGYLNEHYADPAISLNYLAEKYEISPSYLSKSFKEFTTMNFVDCVIQIRMNAAKELLRDRRLSINQIAEQVGYTNVTSFMRSFKKNNGLTPSEFRHIVSNSKLQS